MESSTGTTKMQMMHKLEVDCVVILCQLKPSQQNAKIFCGEVKRMSKIIVTSSEATKLVMSNLWKLVY